MAYEFMTPQEAWETLQLIIKLYINSNNKKGETNTNNATNIKT